MNYKKFGVFRSALWPVQRHESLEVILLMALFFFSAANYHLLRQIKDSVVLVVTNSGMEIMPFIKGFFLFPFSFFSVYLVSLAKKHLGNKTIVFVTIIPFLAYFMCFYYLIYPNHTILQLDKIADNLQRILPDGFQTLAVMIRHWYISLFFAVAELWGTLVLQVVLWGFVNDRTSLSKAKRIYIPLNFSINLAGVLTGLLCKTVLFNPNVTCWRSSSSSVWEQGFNATLLLLFINGILTLLLLLILDPQNSNDNKESKSTEENQRISFLRNMYNVFTKQHTLCLAITVFGFGFIGNMLELFWKEQVRQLYPISNGSFSMHIATIMTWTSLISTLSSILFSGGIIQTIPWRISAMIPPVVVGSSSLLFFSLAAFPNAFSFLTTTLAISHLELTVLSGNIAICIARTSKYVIFDLMKELAYLPLCTFERLQAKAIIDGVVSRAGKITSSISIAFFMSTSGSIYSSTTFAHICCTSIVALWTYATTKLSVLVQKEQLSKEDLKSQD